MRYRIPVMNQRVLTVVLLVGLPVLAIGAAIVLSIGQARLKDAQASRLGEMAQYIAGSVDAYVFRSILDNAVLARVPDIRRAAEEGSARTFDQAAAFELDRAWRHEAAATAEKTGLLNTPASRFLADLRQNDPIIREILVSDRYGRLVAASNVTSDYYQADESWWYETFDQGRGRITITDVQRDESAGVYAFEIALPVPAPGGEQVAGVMKIVADSREMLTGIASVEFGTSAEATLVRSDGTIVFRRRAHRPEDRFFAADLLHQHLEARRSQQEPSGAFQFDAGGEDRASWLVVLAPTQLTRSYPNLDWYVALSVREAELVAPFESLIWYLLIAFALTAIAVLAIALWLSLRLAAPVIDPATDLHLVEHPPVTRSDT